MRCGSITAPMSDAKGAAWKLCNRPHVSMACSLVRLMPSFCRYPVTHSAKISTQSSRSTPSATSSSTRRQRARYKGIGNWIGMNRDSYSKELRTMSICFQRTFQKTTKKFSAGCEAIPGRWLRDMCRSTLSAHAVMHDYQWGACYSPALYRRLDLLCPSRDLTTGIDTINPVSRARAQASSLGLPRFSIHSFSNECQTQMHCKRFFDLTIL